MKQLIYITGSGHSGSTLLDRLLGSHPDIAALGEIHRFSLAMHRYESLYFRCDCGETVPDCPFWSEVLAQLSRDIRVDQVTLRNNFQTTDQQFLAKPSGEDLVNELEPPYRVWPVQPSKYFLALMPRALAPGLERIHLLGGHLDFARNSHALFEAVSKVSGASTIVDSTKNPLRMRALALTSPCSMKVIYLRRDGRAVTNSRMKRQSIGMEQAAKIWVAENRKVRLVLRAMKGIEVLHVNYETLCESLEDETTRIFRFLNLPNLAVDLTTERHALGGNPSRFNTCASVILDDKWRKDLSEEDLALFARIAGREHRHWSFKRLGSPDGV